MTNVTRPVFNPLTGARILYRHGTPPYDPTTGVRIVYGEDRSGPGWDQETGMQTNITAQVNLSQAGAPIPPQAPATEPDYVDDVDGDGEDDGSDNSVVVTRISDQAYEDFEPQHTTGGLTVNQIRAMFRNALGLTDGMVALVDGQTVSNTAVVQGGSNVIFKEPAKRRG
jgi:hypothetical protein